MTSFPPLPSPAPLHPAAAAFHLAPASFDAADAALVRFAAGPACELYDRPGTLPVLVTSVHGFAHVRDGRDKPADSGTLAFSHLLAHASGASWLAVARAGLPDSNHERDTTFKRRLAQLLKEGRIGLVVDIHGAHASRPFDVDIGSLGQASWRSRLAWRDVLLARLERHGFYATDNAVFQGYGSTPTAQTVVAACAALGVPAVQLELSSAYLAELGTRQARHQHAKLANALVQFILHAGGQVG